MNDPLIYVANRRARMGRLATQYRAMRTRAETAEQLLGLRTQALSRLIAENHRLKGDAK